MATEEGNANRNEGEGKLALNRDDEEQDFVDQSKIDFDPDDGLYSGTAVENNSEIPGPHLDSETGELTGMDEARQQLEEQGGKPAPDESAPGESAPGQSAPGEATQG